MMDNIYMLIGKLSMGIIKKLKFNKPSFSFISALNILIFVSLTKINANNKNSYSADFVERYVENDKKVIKLSGNVLFKGDNFNITADDVYVYEELDLITAQNNLKINKDGKYAISASKLEYNTKTKIATLKDIMMLEEGGKAKVSSCECEYNTDNDVIKFFKNINFEDNNSIIKCEYMAFDDIENIIGLDSKDIYKDLYSGLPNYKIYLLKKKVSIYDKKSNVTVRAENCIYDKEKDIAKTYGNSILKKSIDDNTLYFMSDSFLFLKDDKSNTVVEARSKVKLFSDDMQCVTNSMTYNSSDNMVTFEGDTIIWTSQTQINSDKVKVIIEDDKIKNMHIEGDLAILQENELNNYNQISAKSMEAFFVSNKLDKMVLKGNAQSIYELLDNDKKIIGLNYIKSGEIHVTMKEDKANKIDFIGLSQGKIYPPSKEPRFKIGKWRGDERPNMQDVIEVENKLD